MLNMLQINEPVGESVPVLALTNQLPISEVSIMAESNVSKPIRICQVSGCENPSRIRGMCNSCYSKAKRRGDFGHLPCNVAECGNPAIYEDGLCNKHHIRLTRHGTTLSRKKRNANIFEIEGDVCKIYLYNRCHEKVAEAIVDIEDKEYVALRKWILTTLGYVISVTGGTTPPIWLSRYVLRCGQTSLDVDHINRDKLDNRKANLRLATRSQNQANTLPKKDSKSGLKGVSWYKKNHKWVAGVRINRKFIYLGAFSDKYNAAKAYDKKAVELFGEFALTNREIGLL